MLAILSMSASSLRSDSRMRSKVTRTSCSKLMGLLSDGIATPTWPATKIQLPASVSIRSASLKLLAIWLARCRNELIIGLFPASVSTPGQGLRVRRLATPPPSDRSKDRGKVHMATSDEIGRERQRVSEQLARLDAKRAKLANELNELEIAERVLTRFGKTAGTIERRRRER